MMEIRNRTPFRVELVPGLDLDNRDTLTVLAKGTYQIAADGRSLRVAEEQVPVVWADEFHASPANRACATNPMRRRRELAPTSCSQAAPGRDAAQPAASMSSCARAACGRACAFMASGVGSERWASSASQKPARSNRCRSDGRTRSAAWTRRTRTRRATRAKSATPSGAASAHRARSATWTESAAPSPQSRGSCAPDSKRGRSTGAGRLRFDRAHLAAAPRARGTIRCTLGEGALSPAPTRLRRALPPLRARRTGEPDSLPGRRERRAAKRVASPRSRVRSTRDRARGDAQRARRADSLHALHLDTVLLEPDDDRVVLSWRATVPCARKLLDVEWVRVRAAGFAK